MLACLLLTSARVLAADTGSIQGRVFNAAAGRYLENARVTVEGTDLEAFTNQSGEYTIANVPVGAAKVKVEYTGQDPLVSPVTVQANTASTQDVTFNAQQATRSDDGTLVLNEFVVAAERFKNAQQVAVNEERYSTNIKNVVSTDSFGYVHGGNLGEFVKFLPGVETNYGSDDAFSGAGIGGVNQATASTISVRGFGAADTNITIDGMPLSGVAPGALTRATGLDMISVNNASRVEIIKVPTPDMSNEGGGGTVNLVTKSAFEYARPTITANLNVTMNTEETEIFKKTQGPANEKTFHTLPSGSISIAVPLTKKLGFTVSLASANNFTPNDQASLTWQNTTTGTYGTRLPAGATTSAVVNAAGLTPSIINPLMRQISLYDNPWNDFKTSGALKVDWRPIPALNISGNYTASKYAGKNVNRRLQFAANLPKDWSTSHTTGRPFEAASGSLPAINPQNSGTLEVTGRDKVGFTQSGYIKVAYSKGPWSIDGSASFSEAYGEIKDVKNGHFAVIELGLNNVGQVNFLNIKDGVPATIQAFDRAGLPIDYSKLSSWTVANAATLQVGKQKQIQNDDDKTYTLSVRRELDFLPFKMSVKVGGTRREKNSSKAGYGTGYRMRYVGPTLGVNDILDTTYEKTPGEVFGFSAPSQQQWADLYKMYDIYKVHPEWFDENFDITTIVGNYRSRIGQTKTVKEITTSGFAMFDGSLFNNRLTYFGGVRRSEKEVSGIMPFNDSKWNYVKNKDGSLYKDSVYSQGVKVDRSTQLGVVGAPGGQVTNFNFLGDTALVARMTAAGAIFPDHLLLSATGTSATTTNSLEATQRQLYLRAIDTKTKNPVSPSFGLSYKITDKLVIKPSWSRETSPPVLDAGNGTANSQGLLGGYVINESIDAATNSRIQVSNPGLKPKTVDSYNIQLAYYTASGGSLSATYYYKSIKNQWETAILLSDSSEFDEILGALDLDPSPYKNTTIPWQVESTINGDARSKQTGYELAARHGFGFLGKWGSYFDAFATFTHKDSKPSAKANVVQINSSADNFWSAGLQFSASRLSLAARMTYRDEIYQSSGTIAYNPNNLNPVPPQIQTYNYRPEEYKLDVEGSYQFTKKFSFFISGKNVLNSERVTERRDAMNLLPHQVTTNYKFGVQITAGVNAKF